ncbi:type I restriction endonuclease [Thalassotalea sp. SU-HH00458]|uniref:type I restriction endonuclease subunit R n=1 Tax=Thalassotalea sp. SU-HH00458 TaxID=3127657 RepID=UPI00310B038F
MASHHEVHLEEYVVKKLVENGWVEGKADKYDKQRCLYPEDTIAWIKSTQSEVFDKLTKHNGDDTERIILNRLEKELSAKSGGTMAIIRNGFKITGAGNIIMSKKAPEDDRNPEEVRKYKSNILRVVRQLKYNPSREFSIDLVFFINGIPVSTVELKTDFTQSIEDAVEQYKKDRKPVQHGRKEPLLTVKRGAVVHFAMSDSQIRMATELKGDSTYFLPFNQGNDGTVPNKKVSENVSDNGEYPVAYFWEEVCQWDNWLRIFHSFVYTETSDKTDKLGKPYKAKTLIFPRYHQFKAVNKMIADAKDKGPGQQYLCEHSAGSGKTSTIAWTAHDLTKLRYPNGKSYFNSVIIVTDRTVLDSQLQDAVQQLDHQYGMIKAIDREQSSLPKSKQLSKALIEGAPIIVVTIQTFPFAMEAILTEKSLNDRNFAVIIDEAHTSQTGSTAQGLRAALSLDSKTKLEEMSVEELLLEVQKSRVKPANVSHFAFTATPKHNTMTLFGRPKDPTQPSSKENPPVPFHKYTQRQAIEEGFILDVLKNYISYETAYKIGSQIDLKDKKVDIKEAKRSIAQWKSLHPTNITNKVKVIMEHFRKNVEGLLDGEAKAMVVTSRRNVAVKYKLAFDKYIEDNKLHGVKSLVAFSGKVLGKDCGKSDDFYIDAEKEYTESNLNPDVGNQDLRHVFNQQEFKIMIVANKFQTGFNQPKLVAMYIDKKIGDVDAVQTLSRLNRTYPGKDTTFVLDFINDPKDILKAFKKYDEGAVLEDVQDLDVVYDSKNVLDELHIYNTQDLEKFKGVNAIAILQSSKASNVKHEELHKKLYSATQRPTDVYNTKLADLVESIKSWDESIDKADKANDQKAKEMAEAHRNELSINLEELKGFKSGLSKFVSVYTYIAQLIELRDPELENFAAFAKLLAKRLDGVSVERVDLSGLVLSGYAIKENKEQIEAEGDTLKPLSAGGLTPQEREKEFLEEILKQLNEVFGEFGDDTLKKNFTSEILIKISEDEIVSEQINKNTKEQAMEGDLRNLVEEALISSRGIRDKMTKMLLGDEQNMERFLGLLIDGHKKDIVNKLNIL